jgi:hypothetical protein
VATNFVRLKSPYFFFWSAVRNLPGMTMSAALDESAAVWIASFIISFGITQHIPGG